MGVTTNTVALLNGQTDNKSHWCASVYTANASGTEVAVPDPGDGYALCIERIDIMQQTDGTVEIEAPAGTVLFGSIPINADGGGQVTLEFERPIEIPASTALSFTATSGNIAIVTQGFTRKIT